VRFDTAIRGFGATLLGATLVGCGSASSHDVASEDSGAPGHPAGSDSGSTSTKDASADSRSSASGQGDSGSAQGADADIGTSYLCWRVDTAVDCFACCMAYFPLGQQKLMAASASCTCTPSNCGQEGDAGDAGTCSADMCSLKAAPSKSCMECVLGVLEGASGAPLCPESAKACSEDPDCASLLACGANCPGTVMD
jgi:hypothetical protein